jgi:hypothetical protein
MFHRSDVDATIDLLPSIMAGASAEFLLSAYAEREMPDSCADFN